MLQYNFFLKLQKIKNRIEKEKKSTPFPSMPRKRKPTHENVNGRSNLQPFDHLFC